MSRSRLVAVLSRLVGRSIAPPVQSSVSASPGVRFRPAVERFEERDVPAFFTFTLPGEVGYGDFTDPSGVDPARAAQLIPVTGLDLQFQGADFTDAEALIAPVAYYEFGVFAGLSTEFDLSATVGSYTYLLLNKLEAIGFDAIWTATTVPIAAPVPQPFVTIDTRNMVNAMGHLEASQMAITIRLDNDMVNTVLVNQDLNGTTQDLALNILHQLQAYGYTADLVGTTIRIRGHGDAKVEHVTFAVTNSTFYGPDYRFKLPKVFGYHGATYTAIDLYGRGGSVIGP